MPANTNNISEKRRGTAAVSSKNVALARKMPQHPVARRRASDVAAFRVVTKKKDGDKKPFPYAVVLASVCFTVLFLFMMMNYISLDSLNDSVTEQNATINSLSLEKSKLAEKLEKKDNLDEITRYAENELGMVKENEAKGYYINIHREDEININRYEDENENALGLLLTGAGNVIKSFFTD